MQYIQRIARGIKSKPSRSLLLQWLSGRQKQTFEWQTGSLMNKDIHFVYWMHRVLLLMPSNWHSWTFPLRQLSNHTTSYFNDIVHQPLASGLLGGRLGALTRCITRFLSWICSCFFKWALCLNDCPQPGNLQWKLRTFSWTNRTWRTNPSRNANTLSHWLQAAFLCFSCTLLKLYWVSIVVGLLERKE